jgi:hypothetical protein
MGEFQSAVGAPLLQKPRAQNFQLRQEVLAHGHHAAPDGAFSFCELVFYNYAAPMVLYWSAAFRPQPCDVVRLWNIRRV